MQKDSYLVTLELSDAFFYNVIYIYIYFDLSNAKERRSRLNRFISQSSLKGESLRPPWYFTSACTLKLCAEIQLLNFQKEKQFDDCLY